MKGENKVKVRGMTTLYTVRAAKPAMPDVRSFWPRRRRRRTAEKGTVPEAIPFCKSEGEKQTRLAQMGCHRKKQAVPGCCDFVSQSLWV